MLPAGVGPPIAPLVVLGLVLASLLTNAAMAENAELQVLKGNGQFTTNWYKILAEKPGNVFFSPISAHAVLSMAYQGAQGTTAQAFASTLNVPDSKSAVDGYKTIMNRLNNVANVTLLMGNKVYLMEGNSLLEDFKQAVTEGFNSEVQLVNFAQNVLAAKTINDWVEQQTRDKIKDLIKPADLDSLTRLVLVNAIYFKGNWAHQFKAKDTKSEPFYLNDNDSVNVDMMHIRESFNYKEDAELDAQLLEMPYQNPDLSMIIILPKKRNGIKELESKLANVNLANITQGMWNTKVNVALPKFKLEQTIDLKDSLEKMGLGEIFDQQKANFRGMIPLKPNENLYVSKVIQKAFIEVNEEGAEAAAATAVIMVGYSLSIAPEIWLKADHPFIFALVSGPEKTPLFYGKLAEF